MKKHLRDQAGFSAIEVLLVIVILGAVVGVGVYVHKASNNADKTLNSASDTSATPVVKTKKTGSTTTAKARATSTNTSPASTSSGSTSSSSSAALKSDASSSDPSDSQTTKDMNDANSSLSN